MKIISGILILVTVFLNIRLGWSDDEAGDGYYDGSNGSQ
jgi:hypothetical protein